MKIDELFKLVYNVDKILTIFIFEFSIIKNRKTISDALSSERHELKDSKIFQNIHSLCLTGKKPVVLLGQSGMNSTYTRLHAASPD